MYSILCHNFNVRVGTVHLGTRAHGTVHLGTRAHGTVHLGTRAHGTVHTAHVLTYDLIKMLDTYFYDIFLA